MEPAFLLNTRPSTSAGKGFRTPVILAAVAAVVLISTGCVAAAAADQVPKGYFDSAVASGSTITVVGWAFDPDTSESIRAHIYLNGTGVANVAANTSRPDVASAHPGRGPNHGFSHAFTAAEGVHQVCAYAINSRSGAANTPLGCRTVTVNAGGGWSSLNVGGVSPEMVVKVHTSLAGIYNNIAAAVEAVARYTGTTITMGGQTSSTTADVDGVITIYSGLLCGVPNEAGCAATYGEGPNGLITRGLISIAPHTPSQPYLDGVILHELGHAFGLGHFNNQYLNNYQVMHSGLAGGSSPLRAGDVNGLRSLAAKGRATVAQRAAEEAARRAAGGELPVAPASTGQWTYTP